MRLVLLGLPGAGKGTQGDRISEKYGIPHISTGSIIRESIASGTNLGQEADGYISKGELIPDELALRVVHERIIQPDCKRGGFWMDSPEQCCKPRSSIGALPRAV